MMDICGLGRTRTTLLQEGFRDAGWPASDTGSKS